MRKPFLISQLVSQATDWAGQFYAARTSIPTEGDPLRFAHLTQPTVH
jgi:hypothetical protein